MIHRLALVFILYSVTQVTASTCNESVHLVDGEIETEGRVEVCEDGIWGTVCSERFQVVDARIVCKELGHPYDVVQIFPDASSHFGEVINMTILLAEVNCHGNENSIFNCSSLKVGSHIGCFDSRVAGISCFDKSLAICNESSIRLTGGDSSTEGRVEVCYNGQWGTVCRKNFGMTEGRVVCTQLGFPNVQDVYAKFNQITHKFGTGTGEIWLSEVACNGEEETIFDCSSSLSEGLDHACNHLDDVGVWCSVKTAECTNGSVFLVDGQIETEGRIEVCFNGQLGTVCEDLFHIPSGKVVCRQLGYPDAVVQILSFGPGNGNILLDDVRCTGKENSIFECSSVVGLDNCNPDKDIGVRCLDESAGNCTEGSVQLVNGTNSAEGRIEICYNGEWGTVCGSSFELMDGRVLCREIGFSDVIDVYKEAEFGEGKGPIWFGQVQCVGYEGSIFDCVSTLTTGFKHGCGHETDVGLKCSNKTDGCISGSIRLMNGSREREGRVEVCLNEQWGTICNKQFDYEDGRVVCQQLGYSSLNDTQIITSSFFEIAELNERIWLSELQCFGNESNLFDCLYDNAGNCDHKNDVGVRCFEKLLPIAEIPFIVFGLDQESLPATSVSLSCRLDNKAIDNSIGWTWKLKDEVLSSVGTRYSIETADSSISSTLSIEKLRLEDAGSYQCSAWYPESITEPTVGTIQLNLESNLRNFSSTAAYVTSATSSIKFSCELSGYLPSNTDDIISWWRNGVRIETTPEKYAVSESTSSLNSIDDLGFETHGIISRLTVLGISETDNGLYQCVESDKVLNFTIHFQGDKVTDRPNLPTNTVSQEEDSIDSISLNVTDIIIGVSVAASVLMIIGIVILSFCVFIIRVNMKRRMRKQISSMSLSRQFTIPRTIQTDDTLELMEHDYIDIQTRMKRERKLSQALQTCLIDGNDLKIIEKIGQGEFGVVYRGLLMKHESTKTKDGVLPVAVKALKGDFSDSNFDDLMKEAEKMKGFYHQHVLTLTGICIGLLKSPCLVMPFMSNGSLLSYLRKESANLNVSEAADENTILDTTKLLSSMCLQVAKGMEYLSKQNFVHRDLAARNCMISGDGVIKVADFGLAEDLYTSEYFKMNKKEDPKEPVKLPIKWMALESIHYGKFSEKTDVWSYGVLCWEIFSIGRSPYPGIYPEQLVRMLDDGERLKKPTNPACTEEMYAIFESCWALKPESRPSFSELVVRIEYLLIPLAEYMDFDESFILKGKGITDDDEVEEHS